MAGAGSGRVAGADVEGGAAWALSGAGWRPRKKFAEEGQVDLRRVVWAENTGRFSGGTRIAAFCRFLDIQTEVDIG
jgi:hypothetical protein